MATMWRLRDYLHERRIKPATLAREIGGRMSRTSIYNLVQDEPPKALYIETLDAILPALRRLTGEDVTPNDLLEFVPEPEPLDDESRAWLDADLGGLGRYEPYEWAEGELEQGTPIKFVPGTGWVTGG